MASTSKITPSSPRLASLLSDVERGNIKIPVFQREYIWSDDQIISLLDSIYRGYPVGSLLMWSTREELKHERNVGGFALPNTPEDYPVNYILDGQQRLTTLYGVFHSDENTSDAELADRFDICFLPDEDVFVHHIAARGKVRIHLNSILDTTKLLVELSKFNDEQKVKIAKLTESFKDYEFPVVTIRERSNKEVCSIFQRINSSGTPLSNLELLTAWTWSDQFDLRREIDSLLDNLKDKGYEEIDQPMLMRMLSSLVCSSIDSDDLVDVEPEALVQGMNILKTSVSAAVDFLEGQLKVKNIVFLPFPIMLIPIVNFYALIKRPNATQIKQLRKWFWQCALTLRYKAGTNRLVLEDLDKIIRISKGETPFDEYHPPVKSDLFNSTWRINSTAAKTALCLMAQLRPRSFLSGSEVDLGTVLSAYNARQFHHIYPKAYLASNGVTFHEANIISNICFLSASENNSISDKDPKVYFKEIPSEHKEEIFDAALIPEEARDGMLPFEDFVRLRKEKLLEKAQQLITTGYLQG
ncbi:DUF262 domain-containing protein [Serratia marcescens]|uniref:GmrSD restriction endonuclease domain-containing protein n=1 Tax=Serratia marcescens TaxID=615 RepID=UPI000A1712FE|nr:DUF262 domain-containing protein [Serratia marcescens]AWC77667.1 DUF262 domain-containing protein [Serratia marcescens]EIV5188293.1 DUF262 domain-containing protein [Serratia marcescens]EIY2710847.1 DUF262 domain-containing protein [Serratia marcescens]ELQ6279027.1 DUF262 domain-containing protein [Serratia marcescens]EMF1927525.1 DUF262 domain-containing protein [Serratia marcescens]